MAATKEFLNFYLRFSENEIKELDIKALQTSPKDDIMYLAFNNQSSVRNIYRRIAQCKNSDVVTRNFVPPQFFERYMFLSKKCTEMRNIDKNLKTQMRFGKFDVEILTKMRGQSDPFKLIPLQDICDPETIPKYDNEIKWQKKTELGNLRKLESQPPGRKPPSMIPSHTFLHSISRTSSLNEVPKKEVKERM